MDNFSLKVSIFMQFCVGFSFYFIFIRLDPLKCV